MIKVSETQRGNGLLNYLNTAVWQYDAQTRTDYEINSSTAVLFLSLRFHASKPEYIYKRINGTGEFRLRVLMVLVDVPNYNLPLRELFRNAPLTIVLCRSNEECARYLRGFDAAKKRTTDTLRRRTAGIDSFLESFPSINKTDCKNIRSSFKTAQRLLNADEAELSNIAGLGAVKAEGLLRYFRTAFKGNDQ